VEHTIDDLLREAFSLALKLRFRSGSLLFDLYPGSASPRFCGLPGFRHRLSTSIKQALPALFQVLEDRSPCFSETQFIVGSFRVCSRNIRLRLSDGAFRKSVAFSEDLQQWTMDQDRVAVEKEQEKDNGRYRVKQ
jgi:hypothetical protein